MKYSRCTRRRSQGRTSYLLALIICLLAAGSLESTAEESKASDGADDYRGWFNFGIADLYGPKSMGKPILTMKLPPFFQVDKDCQGYRFVNDTHFCSPHAVDVNFDGPPDKDKEDMFGMIIQAYKDADHNYLLKKETGYLARWEDSFGPSKEIKLGTKIANQIDIKVKGYSPESMFYYSRAIAFTFKHVSGQILFSEGILPKDKKSKKYGDFSVLGTDPKVWKFENYREKIVKSIKFDPSVE